MSAKSQGILVQSVKFRSEDIKKIFYKVTTKMVVFLMYIFVKNGCQYVAKMWVIIEY